MSDNASELQRQVALARTEIKNLRQQISALKHEHLKEISLLKSMLDNAAAAGSVSTGNRSSQHSPRTSNQHSPSHETIWYRPIGHVETSFQNKRAVPRQPSVSGECRGRVVLDAAVYNNPEHACDGLMEFSHMWIIFHMHATESNGSVPAKVSPPRLRGERRGVFSTRSPHRPCPIGLSLVKILAVEGNKIEFSGVDMVSGSPVLDVKPYIPQYDYPAADGAGAPGPHRPPTEGDSQLSAPTPLHLQRDSLRLSPRLAHPIGIDTDSPVLHSQPSNYSDDGLDSPDASQELRGSTLMTPVSPSPDSPSSVDLLEPTGFRARSPQVHRPPTERGAPDGQERFTPPQSAHININHDGIRVPQWVTSPPTQPLEVRFSDDVLARLNELIGERAEMFKANLESLLAEDPRSQYVRTRYPDHEYSCVLEDLSISCLFDDAAATCTVIAVRSAEEMQHN